VSRLNPSGGLCPALTFAAIARLYIRAGDGRECSAGGSVNEYSIKKMAQKAVRHFPLYRVDIFSRIHARPDFSKTCQAK
jgi:hypothetical protein